MQSVHKGEGELAVLSRLSLRGQRVPRLVRLMILFFFFLFCLSINELYSCLSDLDDTPRRLVIYDFRASTCILRPRKRERMSMHLRMYQALVIGRAFVRYHPNPLRLRLFVSASSFHFFFLFFFFFFFCICVNRSKEFDLGEVVKLATFDVIYFFCLSLSSWNLLLEHSSKRSKVKLESQMFEIYVDFFLVLREK